MNEEKLFIHGGEKALKKEINYCFECEDFPCEILERLEEGYREKYKMSMIDNLKFIKENGMSEFLKSQEEKYKCDECGDVICVHNGKCYNCCSFGSKFNG